MYPGPRLTGSTSIRLLTLFPDQDDDDAPLRCSLDAADLADNPDFVALSYVWGAAAQPPHVVLCNGHPFEVTENCWEALRQLRRDQWRRTDEQDSGEESNSCALWIDAICINQKDEAEKTGQIQLMGDIYKQASSVCIWLGTGDSQSDLAMAYLETCGFQDLLSPGEMHSYLIPAKAHRRALSRVAFLRYIRVLSFAVRPGNARERNRTTMYLPDQLVSDYVVPRLLGRPWITRVWTLQEAVLNPNPWIQCGSKRLSWRSLVHSIAFIALFGRFNEASHRWIALVKMWNEIHLDPSDREAHDKLRRLFFKRSTPDMINHWAAPIGVSFGIPLLGIVIAMAATTLARETRNIIPLWVLMAICYPYFVLYLLAMVNLNLLTYLSRGRGTLHPGTILNPSRAIVQEIRRRGCFEPMDRIRGAMGVLSQLGINIREPVSADNFAEVSTELTVKWLEGCKSLSLLLCCSNQAPQGQPSWVPNWRLSEEDSWLDPRYLGFTPMDLRSDKYSVAGELREQNAFTRRLRRWFASATGSQITEYQLGTPIRPLGTRQNDGDWPTAGMCAPLSRPVWRLRGDHELALLGINVGHITWVSHDFQETEDTFDETEISRHIHNMENIRALRSRPHSDRLPYPRGPPWHHLPSHYIFDGDTSQSLLSLRRLLFSQFGHWHWLIWRFLDRPAQDILRKLNERPRLISYHIKLTNAFARKQRVLAEASGASFGVRYSNCPRGAEVGDQIFIISGLALPLVLRETQDPGVYRLVGFAEVRSADLMLGKVWWRMHEDEYSSLDEIIIR